jgi:DNA-binding MarR family transcriptional regulator
MEKELIMKPLMKYIGRTERCAVLYRDEILSSYGLNGHQHTYIINICQNPGISQDRLAKIIFVNKSNVARQLTLLEANGFVLRKTSEANRRQMEVYPTEKCLTLYPIIMDILGDWNKYLLDEFTDEEKSALLDMMEKVMLRAATKLENTLSKENDNE